VVYYANGSASDEQDLVGDLHTFLTSTIGEWTRVGIITDTATDKDYVYKSQGTNPGMYRDLYIRIRGYGNYIYLYGYSYWESVGVNDGELHHSTYSKVSVGAAAIPYWFFGDEDHFWIVAKNDVTYYSGHAGYLDTYYTPTDDDLPMVIIGHSSASYGLSSNRMYSYSPVVSGTNVAYTTSTSLQSQFLIYADPNDRDGAQGHVPYVIYTTAAGQTEVRGELKGVLYFSGNTLVSEDWVTISGTSSKFFIRRYSATVCEGFGPVPV